MLISEKLWRSRLEARADVLGMRVTLNGRDATVVGVLLPVPLSVRRVRCGRAADGCSGPPTTLARSRGAAQAGGHAGAGAGRNDGHRPRNGTGRTWRADGHRSSCPTFEQRVDGGCAAD